MYLKVNYKACCRAFLYVESRGSANLARRLAFTRARENAPRLRPPLASDHAATEKFTIPDSERGENASDTREGDRRRSIRKWPELIAERAAPPNDRRIPKALPSLHRRKNEIVLCDCF